MRTRATILTLALLLILPDAAAGQPQSAAPRLFGTFDAGFRSSDIDGDAARFQRFQDTRDQGVGVRFRVDRESPDWVFTARGQNVGYLDQQFQAAAATGRLTVSFDWRQTPLFYGATTATAYAQPAPGVFTLDATARLAVQNGSAIGIPRTPAQAQSASIYRSLASRFDLKSRRDAAAFTLGYAATPEVTLNLGVTSYARMGAQPWGAGMAFSVLPELPLPLDNRTTSLSAGAEWANRRGMLRFGYEGSYFTNRIETLTWDNPVRATDYSQDPRTVTGYDPSGAVTGLGAAVGRMALAPGNQSHGLNGLGLLKLPARTTLTAAFGIARLTQDAALIPWTSNPVIADPRVYAQFPGLASLPRATADADVRVSNATVTFATRPRRAFGLTARYRLVDRDGRTPAFDATEYVRFDATPVRGGGITRPFDLRRHTLNVDATLTPIRHTAVRLGVGRDLLDHARAHGRLADTTLRGSVHLVGHQAIAVRASHEHTIREGSRFDAGVLAAAGGGVQPASRWYDDASRTRDRTTLLVDLTPASMLGVYASMFVGRDRYDDARQQFGLLNNDNTGYTVGVSLVPSRHVALGASYGYERYTALQRSRTASGPADATWNDPLRNWDLDTDETVHTVGVTLDLLRLFRNTEIRLGYDRSASDQGFLYGGPRIDALAAIGQFVPVPAVTNAWQRATVDVRYFLTPQVGVGGGYWYNKFDVNDYQTLDLSPGVPRTDYIGSLMLGYGYRPFQANTGFLRLFYLF
jgi:MtrB/PioB family decaheme-associated outer membrane protein